MINFTHKILYPNDPVPKTSCEEIYRALGEYLINIIKLCDNPAYGKEQIRQVANDVCCYLYTNT